MAMNQREKYLAAGVGVIVTLFVGQYLVNSVRSGFEKKKQIVESLKSKKDQQDLEVAAGLVASQKLNIISKRSLPKSEEKALADYMEWLIALGEASHLQSPTPRGLGDIKDKDDAFHLYRFQLIGNGTVENVTELLYGFYAKNYIHRISRLDIRPNTNTKGPDLLTITMDCEVLALGVAKEKQPPPKEFSDRLAKSLQDYKQYITERNLFSPANNAPALAPTKSVDATVGLRIEHNIDAKDLDVNQTMKYELVGEAPKGLALEKSTGKLTWVSNEVGEFNVSVKATDSGIPARSALQSLTIKVKEAPKPKEKPPEFDIASQAMVTALIAGKNGPEAWVLSKTDSKTFYLRKGDKLKLGDVEGQVVDVGTNYLELETKGRRWTVGLDESLADAYARIESD